MIDHSNLEFFSFPSFTVNSNIVWKCFCIPTWDHNFFGIMALQDLVETLHSSTQYPKLP